MDTLARAPGGQMRGAATQAMSDIVKERQQSRCPPPPRPSGLRPAGFVARSSHTAPGIARRSRLASGPGGQQQSAHIISSQTLRVQVRVFLFRDKALRFIHEIFSSGLERAEILKGARGPGEPHLLGPGLFSEPKCDSAFRLRQITHPAAGENILDLSACGNLNESAETVAVRSGTAQPDAQVARLVSPVVAEQIGWSVVG